MKHLSGKGIATRENLFAMTFLFVFALILLVSDPEWLMWAGPITLGAFPVGAAPASSLAAVPLEKLQAASYLILPGLLALILLVRIRGKARDSRRSEFSRPAAVGYVAAHAESEQRKAA